MTKNNILIQEQVLMMILSATGSLPNSFALDNKASDAGSKSELPISDKTEKEVLEQVVQ